MSETWMAIIFASLAVYSWKVIGYLVPSHVLNHPRVSRIASLLTVVLLAALLGTQSFAAGSQISLDERVPAAEVHETPEAYEVVLELPGVDKAAIEVKASERTLLISAERRSQRQLGGQPSEAGASATSSDAPATVEKDRGPLLSEFRYGTWSRSFRFPQPIEREQLQAVYRDGLLTVTAPKANTVSSVTVKVEG